MLNIIKDFHRKWNLNFFKASEDDVEDSSSSNVHPLAVRGLDTPSVLTVLSQFNSPTILPSGNVTINEPLDTRLPAFTKARRL